MIIINYKAYRKAIGKNAEKLTQKIEKAAENTDKKIITVPQTADLNRVKNKETLKYAQHVDSVDTGSHTGSNQVKTVKQAGAQGTIINHSEKRIKEQKIKEIVQKCREENLTSIVCAQSPEECEKYSKYKPDFLAFEPPELIGGNTSVSKAEPEIIEEAVEKSGEIPTLAGAGIKTREDVQKSIERGCKGILVASGVIKADNVQEEVEELCKGL
jgi:triosephosphate isomerase